SGNGADSAFGTTTTSSVVNSDIGALTGTLTVAAGNGTPQTLTFGAGNITNRAQLSAALAGLGITGLTASITGNAITFASTSDDALALGGSVLPALGLTAGTT